MFDFILFFCVNRYHIQYRPATEWTLILLQLCSVCIQWWCCCCQAPYPLVSLTFWVPLFRCTATTASRLLRSERTMRSPGTSLCAVHQVWRVCDLSSDAADESFFFFLICHQQHFMLLILNSRKKIHNICSDAISLTSDAIQIFQPWISTNTNTNVISILKGTCILSLLILFCWMLEKLHQVRWCVQPYRLSGLVAFLCGLVDLVPQWFPAWPCYCPPLPQGMMGEMQRTFSNPLSLHSENNSQRQ